MSKYARSGQYELTKAVIKTNSSNPIELDIKGSFVDAAVYESIFEHTMSGNISIADTNNLIQRYALGRGELIELEWNTSGVSQSILASGIVYDITGPVKLNDHSSGFTLHFASPEFIASIKNKMFTGHNEPCSTIVERIFEKIRRQVPIKTKPLVVETTRNLENVVFTGQTALEAVQMLAERSVSTTGSNGFIFFENNLEFNFTSIESLYKKDPVIEFSFKSSGSFEDVKNAHEEMFNTFQSFDIMDNNKYSDDLLDGQYGSAWGYLSLIDKSMNVYNYDSKKNFDQNKSLGKSSVSLDKNFNNDFSDRLSIDYSLNHEMNEPHCVNNRMKLLKTNTFVVDIGAFGNSTLKVGEVCLASIPSFSSESLTPDAVDHVSGKFLVVEIKHILANKQYNQKIKLIKDSYEGAIS
jgi:hypothetical protein